MVKYAKNCVEHVAECEAFRGVSGLSLPTAMRKATAILLLMVFLFEGGGYFVYFTLERAAAQREMAAFMKRLKSEDNLIRIEWNAGNAAEFNWKHEREFRYHGVMYDVMRREQSDDGSIVLICHPDKRESAVYRSLESKSKKNKPDGKLAEHFCTLTHTIPEEPVQIGGSAPGFMRSPQSFAETMVSEPHTGTLFAPPEHYS